MYSSQDTHTKKKPWKNPHTKKISKKVQSGHTHTYTQNLNAAGEGESVDGGGRGKGRRGRGEGSGCSERVCVGRVDIGLCVQEYEDIYTHTKQYEDTCIVVSGWGCVWVWVWVKKIKL